jgi:ankyrin repeat protein
MNKELRNACYIGNINYVKAFIRNGGNINIKCGDGCTCLFYASYRFLNVQLIKWLLKNGADPNIKNNHGSTPLMNASTNGCINTVRTLLKYGADPNITNKFNSTALIRTIRTVDRNYTIMILLLKAGANPFIKDNDGYCVVDFYDNKIDKLLYKRVIFVPLFHKRFRRINSDIVREAVGYS